MRINLRQNLRRPNLWNEVGPLDVPGTVSCNDAKKVEQNAPDFLALMLFRKAYVFCFRPYKARPNKPAPNRIIVVGSGTGEDTVVISKSRLSRAR